jgi:hypothetical protein
MIIGRVEIMDARSCGLTASTRPDYLSGRTRGLRCPRSWLSAKLQGGNAIACDLPFNDLVGGIMRAGSRQRQNVSAMLNQHKAALLDKPAAHRENASPTNSNVRKGR